MIKVSFFNLENFFLDRDIGLSRPRKSLEKTHFIARTIKEMNPDILGVCEVGGIDSLRTLCKNYLDDQWIPSLIEGNSDRSIHLGFLIKKNLPFKFEHLTHRNRPLNFSYQRPSTKSSKSRKKPTIEYMSRDIAELRMIDKEGQIKLIVLTVHLKSQLDKEGKDWRGLGRRKAELELTLGTWKNLKSRFPHIPIIIQGDFNIRNHADDRANQELLPIKSFPELVELLDYSQAHDRQDGSITWLGFDHHNRPAHCQLDYFWMEEKWFSQVNLARSGVYRYRGKEGQVLPIPQNPWQRHTFPSDHFPLLVEFMDIF